jgi:hypothetical protein
MSDPTTVTVRDVEAAREQRRIALARIIAAEMGGLVRDAYGAQLPDTLWMQALPRADAILALIGARPIVSSAD